MLFIILIICYQFTTTYGFRFDDPPASLIAWIPTALTWHRNSDDPNDIYFERRNVVSQSSGNGDSVPSSSDTTQPQGTLTVTFPSAGYVIEVLESQTDDVIGSSHSLTVASQVQDDGSSTSATGAPSFTPVSTTTTSSPLTTTSTGPSPQTTSSSGIVSKHSAYYVTSASSPTASSAREQNSSVYDPIISTPTANPASSSPPSRSESPGLNSNRHPIIIGTTVGSLVFLLLLLGIGIFFFTVRKRVLHYRQSIILFPPPDDEGKSESIYPVFAVGMAHSSTNIKDPAGNDRRRITFGEASRPFPVDPQIGGSARKQARPGRQEAPQSGKGKRIKFARLKRNNFCTVSEPFPVDYGSAREQASPDGEERLRATLDDIETEVLRLKTQVYQILIQQEAERVQGGPFDRPPSYADTTF